MKTWLKAGLGLLLVSSSVSVTAQSTPTQRVPMCLQFLNPRQAVPCGGVVPIDTATGNPLSWQDLFGKTSTGSPSTNATPVQNNDGTKLATETSVQQLKTALGTPYQAGGNLPLPAGAATDTQLVNAVSQLTTIVARQTSILAALQGVLSVSSTVYAITFTDRTVTLSAGQAAGTTAVIAANPNRKAFAITPTNDGRLYIGGGTTGFYYPLYAGVVRSISGLDCPSNALYVTGQTSGTVLPMSEG